MSYKNQHTIPKAYLKYFATNGFVNFIELKNQYSNRIRKEGIGHKIFSKTNYYNFKGDPFLEKAFSKIESKDYEIIIDRLINKQNIGHDTKQRIIEWVMMLKLRNTAFRDNFTRLSTWMEKTHYGLIHGRKAMEEKEADFTLEGKRMGKAAQLSALLEKERHFEALKGFSINFLNRHWVILTADDTSFITNDNPGFSVSFSIDILRLGLSPLSSQFNLDNSVNSIHYFPLTDKMCLKLFPIIEGDLPELTMSEMEKHINSDIKFEKATKKEISIINDSTFRTSNEIVISRQSNQLEAYLDK